jgi:hypothetical protein
MKMKQGKGKDILTGFGQSGGIRWTYPGQLMLNTQKMCIFGRVVIYIYCVYIYKMLVSENIIFQ